MSETNSIVKVLQSKNKENVKELIRSETSHLGSALRIINMESFAPEVVSKRRAISKPFMKRRSINRTFMKCLIDVKQGRRSALLWLKKNVDFEICDIIKDDVDYSGKWYQKMMDKITQMEKSVQTSLAKKVKEKCNRWVKKWFNITYNGIRRVVLVSIMYLDLCLDSILLFNIFTVLSSTIDFGNHGHGDLTKENIY